MAIIVAGSSNTDLIIKTPKIPRPGETVINGQFFQADGGKGANQAVAAQRAGGNVSFVARTGSDSFGSRAKEKFEAEGINVAHMNSADGVASGIALIFVDDAGENSIAVASGANSLLAPADVQPALESAQTDDIVLMQLEVPLETVTATAKYSKGKGLRVILNPAPAQKLPDELLDGLYCITPNEHEAEMLTGYPVTDAASAESAARVLLDSGVHHVIITLGARGVFLANADTAELLCGFKVDAVDTTAAGDVFNGALAAALSQGKEMKDAITFAQAAAAISVTRMGAQPSAPGRSFIEQYIADNAVASA